MKRFLFSIVLLIVSIAITRYIIISKFFIFLFIATIIHLIFLGGIKKALENIGDYFWECAYIQDLGWNIFLQVPMNLLFCSFSKNYYLYGVPGETISSATGKNLVYGNKNIFLKGFSKMLDFFLGKDHCINAIQNEF